MGFFGCRFSYAGESSFEYGLMLYDIGDANEDGTFSSASEIKEDRTVHRYTPMFYGTVNNQPLTFTLTMGADLDSIEKHKPIDRWDFDAIATWLTQPWNPGYNYLEIFQPDMEAVRYKCIITNLEYTTYGKLPWALTCQVTCDSPYAYLWPEEHTIESQGGKGAYNIVCRAASRYYRPKFDIELTNQGNPDFRIWNEELGNSGISISGMPKAYFPCHITIDNENEVITCQEGHNLYKYCNFDNGFFKLGRGYNRLSYQFIGVLKFTCEYPTNVGG